MKMINSNASKYCCEDLSLIENYDEAANSDEMWECHHKLELIETGGLCNCSKQDLIDWNLYWHRPANELIFITRDKHHKLHMTSERRQMISDSMKGGNSTSFQEGHKVSDETKTKISKTLHNKRKVIVEFSNGQRRTTKEIAEVLGWASSSKVGQYIRNFGYIPCNGVKLNCHIVET